MITRAAALTDETLEGIEDFAAPADDSVQKLIQKLSGKEIKGCGIMHIITQLNCTILIVFPSPIYDLVTNL